MSLKKRTAIARIFADIIKADRIVDTGEMVCWRNLCAKYGIDREARVQAGQMPFAKALTIISSTKETALKKDLLDDCMAMTVSDGFCAFPEALLMIALQIMFSPYTPFKSEVFSIPRTGFDIDIAAVLYIENDYDRLTNEAIVRDYRSIYKEFQLAGFHFIYIPRIIEHYRNTDPDLFKYILSFLAPTMSEQGIDNTYRSLMKMTSGIFCKDLLCNKCGIDTLRHTRPSLLIKIGNSYVSETQYANFLKIEVGSDTRHSIQRLVDMFTPMLRSDILVVHTSEENNSQFHFHGFYKQLLDIFLVRRNIRSTILIDPYKAEIFFPETDCKAKGLNRRERALYALLLCRGTKGISFRAPRSASEMDAFNRNMTTIHNSYTEIYSMFGGDRMSTPDLSIPEIRRPIISRLKGSLRKIPALYNPQDYNITKNSDGVLSVNIEPELVFVSSLDRDEPVPLKESELYNRCSEWTH